MGLCLEESFIRESYQNRLKRTGVGDPGENAYKAYREGLLGNSIHCEESGLSYLLYEAWYNVGRNFRKKIEENSESKSKTRFLKRKA